MTYLARDARRRYVGLLTKLDVFVQAPRQKRVMQLALSLEPPESLEGAGGTRDGEGRGDREVYDLMFTRTPDEIGPRLAAAIFSPASAR